MDANLCYQKQKKKEVEFSADLKLKQCTSFVMLKNHCVQLYLGVWSVIEKKCMCMCVYVSFSFFFFLFFLSTLLPPQPFSNCEFIIFFPFLLF